jgi:hypothetical protein
VSILARIRAHDGEVIRDEWRLTIRRGRLTDAAMAWLREPRRKAALLREVWPEADVWEERAAIREFDAGQDRATAEREAFREVMGC